MTKEIYFEAADVSFPDLNQQKVKTLLLSLLKKHNCQFFQLSYIFCSDSFLLDINIEHLNHNYYTDIITFNLSDTDERIEADLFISIDRVKDNAEKLLVSFEEELIRVICHGLLHLLGLNDKTDHEVEEMRKAEEACLSLWRRMN